MKPTTKLNSSVEAERLLEQLFKAGASHYYIFDRMQSQTEMKTILNAPSEVAVEVLLRLTALISKALTSKQAEVHANCAALAKEIIPGLRDWKDKGSDWLGSGMERVPPQLVPLLLCRTLACDDSTFARLLGVCCIPRTPYSFLLLRDVIQAFIGQAIRRARSEGTGNETRKVLLKLQSKLARLSRAEISRLGTWAKKQAVKIELGVAPA